MFPGLHATPAGLVRTESNYASRVQSVVGADYLDQLVGSGIVLDGSNNITNWTTFIGASATNTSPSRFKGGTLLSRPSSAPGNIGQAKSLSVPLAAVAKDIFVVSEGVPLTSGFETLADSGDSLTAFMDRDSATPNWYLVTGWTFQRNNVADNVIATTGVQLYRASNAGNVNAGATILGWKTGFRVWGGRTLTFVFARNVVAATVAQTVWLLSRDFYGF